MKKLRLFLFIIISLHGMETSDEIREIAAVSSEALDAPQVQTMPQARNDEGRLSKEEQAMKAYAQHRVEFEEHERPYWFLPFMWPCCCPCFAGVLLHRYQRLRREEDALDIVAREKLLRAPFAPRCCDGCRYLCPCCKKDRCNVKCPQCGTIQCCSKCEWCFNCCEKGKWQLGPCNTTGCWCDDMTKTQWYGWLKLGERKKIPELSDAETPSCCSQALIWLRKKCSGAPMSGVSQYSADGEEDS